MKKGIYLLPENDCLKPASGPNRHYLEGLRELKRHFDIRPVNIFVDQPELNLNKLDTSFSVSPFKQKLLKWKIFGSLRDIKFFLRNHIGFYRYYRTIRNERPDFIYERAAFLNYNGIVIARMLDIPHFYEINGLNAEQMKDFYGSYLVGLLKRIQRRTYEKSTFNFCVGDLGRFLKIRTDNHMAVQNGIEKEFVDEFSLLRRDNTYPLKIVWVGKAMAHHRLDIFIDALKELRNREKIEIYFVGERISEYLSGEILKNFKIHLLGAIPHDKLASILRDMHIGILPYTFEFGSNLKLFLYGGAKLAVVAPDVENIRMAFSRDEIVYFRQLDSRDMAAKLDELIEDRNKIESFSEKIYRKVSKAYTWGNIYSEISSKIESYL